MTGYLRMQCQELPYYLAVQMIRNRLRSLVAGRNWSSMRAETQLLPDNAKSGGTLSVTRGSASVVGTGTSFASTDVGRQLMAGLQSPVYTISAVTDSTHLTLDQVYGGTTNASMNYQILDAYAYLPADFKQFVSVVDPTNAWQLRYWVQQEQLNSWDPQRTSAGTPWVLADLGIKSATAQPMFELWPYTTSARVYSVRYFKILPDLNLPTDEVPRLVRGDVLVKGAMIDVCRWPGTRANPNLLFGKGLDSVYEREYNDLVNQAQVEDENLMLTWLRGADWASYPAAPIDAKWLQSHAY